MCRVKTTAIICAAFISAYSAVYAMGSDPNWSQQAYNLTLESANSIRSGNPALALQQLQQAVAIAPESWDVNFNIGLALEQLGRWQEALQWYQKAYSINPQRHSALLGVARIYYDQKDYKDALPILAELAERYPATESTYPSYLSLAKCYAEMGQIDNFCKTMNAALSVKSNDPVAWRFAAQELDHLKQYDLAIKYYGEYLKRFTAAPDRDETVKRVNDLSFNKQLAQELSAVESGFSLDADTDDLANFVTYLDAKHTGVSDKACALLMLGLSQIPRSYRQQLEKAGYKVVLAPTVLDAMPELASVNPRGYADGASWHATNGAFDRKGKRIIVGEKCNSPAFGGKLVEGPLDETVQHEFGHAYDAFLGQLTAKNNPQTSDDPNPDFSHSKIFSEQYDLDAANVPEDLRAKLAYYLQAGHAGKEELFAQMFVLFFGHQPEPGSPRESFQIAFPHVLKVLEDGRKSDPDYERLHALYDERLKQNTLTPKERVKELLK